ncbi:MAG: hypothetical protein JWM09_351 [Francisellaceae bacterium]|nr:hypothetical protein [Francisellaceae bacterium]
MFEEELQNIKNNKKKTANFENLTSEQIENLFEVLKDNRSVTSICLSGCGNIVAHKVAELLLIPTNGVSDIYLSNNSINNLGALALINSLETKTSKALFLLQLSNNLFEEALRFRFESIAERKGLIISCSSNSPINTPTPSPIICNDFEYNYSIFNIDDLSLNIFGLKPNLNYKNTTNNFTHHFVMSPLKLGDAASNSPYKGKGSLKDYKRKFSEINAPISPKIETHSSTPKRGCHKNLFANF